MIKKWPIGEDKGYLQLVNPYVIGHQNKDSCAVKVVSYRDEPQDSLEAIKEETANRLVKIAEMKSSKIRYAVNVFVLVISYSTFGAITASFVTGKIDSSSLAGLAAGLGELAACSVGGFSLGDSINKGRERKRFKCGVRTFLSTPVSKFSQETNKQLQDIANSIESNTIPKYMMFDNENECSGVQTLLKELDGKLIPNTKSVYESITSRTKSLS